MDNLNYVVNWGKDKQKAWSGTNYGLYVALSKLFQIKEIELQDHKPTLFAKILNKIFHKMILELKILSIIEIEY